MTRRAGRVFVKAPQSYLDESSAHSQITWDLLTREGANDVQREYVIKDKVKSHTGSSRGRKSIPPKCWLEENESNTHDVWNVLMREEKLAIRIKYTTGKYRKFLDKSRKDDKAQNMFTKEKRGRPARVTSVVSELYSMLCCFSIGPEDDKKMEFSKLFYYIDDKYINYVEKLFFPLVEAMHTIISENRGIPCGVMAKHLLKMKVMNVRMKALNDVWDRLKGAKALKRWRSFKKPHNYLGDNEAWKSKVPLEQLFIIHDLELMRYIELDNTNEKSNEGTMEIFNELITDMKKDDIFNENDLSLECFERSDLTVEYELLKEKTELGNLLSGEIM